MKEKKKMMSWYNVSLSQFLKIQEASKIEDNDERLFAVAEAMFGDKVTELPLIEFKEKVGMLTFLGEPLPEVTLPKKVEVNGRKYFMDCLLGNISTAQYVDYTNHAKTNDICKMMSVFLIPEGHKYNDGYDMLQVFNDINDLPIPVVQSAAFFFGKQFSTFMDIFRRYSIRTLKKTKMPKEQMKAAIKVVENSVDMVLYPLSSNFVR